MGVGLKNPTPIEFTGHMAANLESILASRRFISDSLFHSFHFTLITIDQTTKKALATA